MGRPRTRRLDLPERVYYKNGAYYYVINNKWKRLSSDYQEAMAAWASLVKDSFAAGRTVGELLDRYALEIIPTKAERTQADNRQEIRFLRAFFGGMALDEVAPSHVALYVENRRARTRANREVALLSHAFNKAILWGLTTSNPASVRGVRNRERPRDRYVTDEEIEKFKEVCPQWLKDYVDLKLLLGLRRGDLLSLKWQMIAQEHITLTTSKTGKKLSIQITPEVQEVLSRLSRSSDWLFPNTSGRQYTSNAFNAFWQRMMNEYTSRGNQRFHEHDLRGKVATDIGDSHAAKRLLGHKSIKMTEAYIKARSTDVVQPATRRSKDGKSKTD